MNAMQEAFVAAGIKQKSKTERIWQVLHDRGPMKSITMAKVIGIDERDALKTMSSMKSRGMLSVHRERGSRQAVYTALGKDYEEARAGMRKPIRVTDIKPPSPVTQTFTVPVTPPKPTVGLFALPPEVEGFTIRDLSDLRKTLNALFEGG